LPYDEGAEIFSTIYESDELREVTGPAIRPGGVELTARAVEFCSFPKGARLLDVGCGEGASVSYLGKKNNFVVSGIDASSRLVADGLGNDPDLPLMVGRAEELPFDDGSLDGVLCECVLSLLTDPAKALREIYRVLAPGGYLILSDIYLMGAVDPGYRSEGKADGCLKGALPIGLTASMLEEAGFDILLREDHTRCLKELGARLILAGKGLDGFCAHMDSKNGDGGKPGYYLMVARKDS
jgi:SAM-dependent methyltransferase